MLKGGIGRNNFNLPGVKRRSVSTSSLSNTKSLLQDRVILGFSGDSLNSDYGKYQSATTGGTVSSAKAKFRTNSLSLNEQHQALSISINSTLSYLKQVSFICWTYFNALSGSYGGPFGSVSNTGVVNAQLYMGNAIGADPGNAFFQVFSGSNYYDVSGGVGSWTTGTWIHNICEIDRINNFIRLFINGELKQEKSIPSNFSLNIGVDTFGLGGYQLANHGATDMNGYIQDFAILMGNTSPAEREYLKTNSIF